MGVDVHYRHNHPEDFDTPSLIENVADNDADNAIDGDNDADNDAEDAEDAMAEAQNRLFPKHPRHNFKSITEFFVKFVICQLGQLGQLGRKVVMIYGYIHRFRICLILTIRMFVVGRTSFIGVSSHTFDFGIHWFHKDVPR